MAGLCCLGFFLPLRAQGATRSGHPAATETAWTRHQENHPQFPYCPVFSLTKPGSAVLWAVEQVYPEMIAVPDNLIGKRETHRVRLFFYGFRSSR